MVDVVAESMVGGTIFHREVIPREISRALVLNLSGKANGDKNTAGRSLPLTQPSLLSRVTPRLTLTGYAYETVPNKPIIAGKTKGPDVITAQPGGLGRLAQGSVGRVGK